MRLSNVFLIFYIVRIYNRFSHIGYCVENDPGAIHER